MKRKMKKSYDELLSFYCHIYDYYDISELYAVHKGTGRVFDLLDCDGLAFDDVISMFYHHYLYKNGVLPFALYGDYREK